MIEVTVARLGLDSSTNSFVVVLREKNGQRLLPIWIGRPEAESIVMQMNHVKLERPMTHDLCQALIQALGATLTRVTISAIKKSTYFAELLVEGPNGVAQIDARPSDSIAMALRFHAPIFADESLLADFDDDEEDETAEAATFFAKPIHGEMTPEQLKEYLADLRPEDFGKFSP